jgi:myosin protein heavy chain/myosin heavy chain 6/7
LCVFQAQNLAASYEKKQKKIDQEIAQWKSKLDEVQAELEASQRESRANSTEVRILISL